MTRARGHIQRIGQILDAPIRAILDKRKADSPKGDGGPRGSCMPAVAKMFLIAVGNHAGGEDGWCYTDQLTLQDETGLERKAIGRAAAILEELGIVEIQERRHLKGQDNDRRDNIYRIDYQALKQRGLETQSLKPKPVVVRPRKQGAGDSESRGGGDTESQGARDSEQGAGDSLVKPTIYGTGSEPPLPPTENSDGVGASVANGANGEGGGSQSVRRGADVVGPGQVLVQLGIDPARATKLIRENTWLTAERARDYIAFAKSDGKRDTAAWVAWAIRDRFKLPWTSEQERDHRAAIDRERERTAKTAEQHKVEAAAAREDNKAGMAKLRAELESKSNTQNQQECA